MDEGFVTSVLKICRLRLGYDIRATINIVAVVGIGGDRNGLPLPMIFFVMLKGERQQPV